MKKRIRKRIAEMEPGTVFKWELHEGINTYILTSRKKSDYGVIYAEVFLCGKSHLLALTGNTEVEIIGRIGEDGRMEEVEG